MLYLQGLDYQLLGFHHEFHWGPGFWGLSSDHMDLSDIRDITSSPLVNAERPYTIPARKCQRLAFEPYQKVNVKYIIGQYVGSVYWTTVSLISGRQWEVELTTFEPASWKPFLTTLQRLPWDWKSTRIIKAYQWWLEWSAACNQDRFWFHVEIGLDYWNPISRRIFMEVPVYS